MSQLLGVISIQASSVYTLSHIDSRTRL